MNKEAIDKNPVVKLSFEFSLEVIAFCELLESQKRFVIARQLLKSGTSIGANVIEAQNAESKADFIHKFKKPPRKQKRQNIGSCFVNMQRVTLTANLCYPK